MYNSNELYNYSFVRLMSMNPCFYNIKPRDAWVDLDF